MNRGVFCDALAVALPPWVMGACGVTAILLWLLHRPEWRPLAWGLVAAGAMIAGWRARGHFFRDQNAAAWLDRQRELHGLGALAQDGVALPAELGERLAQAVRGGRLALRWSRLARPLFLPLVTLLALQSIPWKSEVIVARGERAMIQQRLDRHQERLETLEQEKLLPESDLAELKKELEDLNRTVERSGSDPMVLEATDRMAEQMAKMEATALNRLQASLETANSLQELTVAGKAMEDWQKTELRTRAAELLQKMKELGLGEKELGEMGNETVAEMMRAYLSGSQGQMPENPQAAEEMAEAMKKWLQAKADRAGEYKLGGAAEGSYLTETEEERQALRDSSRTTSGGPGKGGVSRGRGDADLTFEDEKHLEDKAFKPRMLPEGASPSADHSLTISVQALDPKAAPTADRATLTPAAEAAARTEGRGAAVPLRHREVVRKYFSSEPGK